MIRVLIKTFVFLSGVLAWSQAQPTPLQVNRIFNITSSTTCIDERAVNRQANYHSYIATGTGTWSVQMQWSNTSCTGPWTSYGSAALVSNTSNPPIGYGNDGFNTFANFISFVITGSGVSINYSSSKNFYLSTSTGAVIFPVSIGQGGTGATTAPGALANLGAMANDFSNNTLSYSQLQYLRRKANTTSATAFEFASLPVVVANDYIWPSQTCNGSNVCSAGGANGSALVNGVSATLTLTPCPLGVNGSDAKHYYYISGGSGTAEAVLGTGGSCTSGASSGTLIFTPNQGHTGAWTIGTANLGCREAISALGAAGGTVMIAPGSYTAWNAPCTATSSPIAIVGDRSRGAVFITDQQVSGNTFEFDGGGSTQSQNVISNIKISSPSKTTGAGVYVNNQNTFTARDLYIANYPIGISLNHASTFSVFIEDTNISAIAGTGQGILINNATDVFIRQLTETCSSAANGIQIVQTGGVWLDNSDILTCGNGIVVSPGAGQTANYGFITSTAFDTNSSFGMLFSPSSTGTIRSWHISNSWSNSNTLSGIAVDNGASGTVDGIEFSNHRSENNAQRGLITFNAATNVKYNGGVIAGNGATTIAGIEINSTGNFDLHNATVGQAEGFPNTQTYGLAVINAAAPINVSGNIFTANLLGPISDSSTSVNRVVSNNRGIDDSVPPTLTPSGGGVLTLGVTDQSNVFVQGSTAVSAINAPWNGRAIVLTFIGATPGGVASGGAGNSIVRTLAAVQYQRISCVFLGALGINWVCQ